MLAVWAVDAGRVRRGQLVPLECSAVLRDCDVGTWSVAVRDDALARRIAAGWRLIMVDDGELIVSGPVVAFGSDVGEGRVVLSGVDDLCHVADRLVYPDPSLPADAQTTDAYYKRSGPAETVVRDLIDSNAGAGAIVARRAAGVVVDASQGRGAAVSTNLRFKNLLEESRALCRIGGVTFTAMQESDGQIWVRFRVPQDLSRRVRFTRQNGGMLAGSYELQGPSVTDVVVAGQGEGAARTIVERSQASLWGRRIEQFQDRRDTDEVADLEQAGDETLADGAAGASASVEVQEVPGCRFGTDYRLGDTVTAEFGGTTVVEPVRSAEVQWDGHGRTVRLSLGDHEQDDDRSPAWVRFVRDLSGRVRGLETR